MMARSRRANCSVPGVIASSSWPSARVGLESNTRALTIGARAVAWPLVEAHEVLPRDQVLRRHAVRDRDRELAVRLPVNGAHCLARPIGLGARLGSAVAEASGLEQRGQLPTVETFAELYAEAPQLGHV